MMKTFLCVIRILSLTSNLALVWIQSTEEKAAMDMIHEVPVPHVWQASWLTILPQKALMRLVQLHAFIEILCSWPSSEPLWKMCFILKR